MLDQLQEFRRYAAGLREVPQDAPDGSRLPRARSPRARGAGAELPRRRRARRVRPAWEPVSAALRRTRASSSATSRAWSRRRSRRKRSSGSTTRACTSRSGSSGACGRSSAPGLSFAGEELGLRQPADDAGEARDDGRLAKPRAPGAPQLRAQESGVLYFVFSSPLTASLSGPRRSGGRCPRERPQQRAAQREAGTTDREVVLADALRPAALSGSRRRPYVVRRCLPAGVRAARFPMPEHVPFGRAERIARWLEAKARRGRPRCSALRSARPCASPRGARARVRHRRHVLPNRRRAPDPRPGRGDNRHREAASSPTTAWPRSDGWASPARRRPQSATCICCSTSSPCSSARARSPTRGETVGALFFTTLLPSSPKLMINVETDDHAVVAGPPLRLPDRGARLHPPPAQDPELREADERGDDPTRQAMS